MDLWTACQTKKHIAPFKTTAWRVVEDQATSSTRQLVDSLVEHHILEQEIEKNKPSQSRDCNGLHYLLHTPLRYPPLKHGSRFGKKTEPSLWYGSQELSTALAEKAYYRFVLLFHSEISDKTDRVAKTAFKAAINTQLGLDLTKQHFQAHRDILSSPLSWQVSQSLGSKMRSHNIEAFSYFSGRDQTPGAINIGVFTCRAFAAHQQRLTQYNLMEFSNRSVVEFHDNENQTQYLFKIEDFMLDGKFPLPAD